MSCTLDGDTDEDHEIVYHISWPNQQSYKYRIKLPTYPDYDDGRAHINASHDSYAPGCVAGGSA